MCKSLIFFFLCVIAATSVDGSESLRRLFKRGLAKGVAAVSFYGLEPSLSHALETVPSVSKINVSYQNKQQPIATLLGPKATLVFNFAGQCDLPADGEPQCGELVELYKRYNDQGFQILGKLVTTSTRTCPKFNANFTSIPIESISRREHARGTSRPRRNSKLSQKTIWCHFSHIRFHRSEWRQYSRNLSCDERYQINQRKRP